MLGNNYPQQLLLQPGYQPSPPPPWLYGMQQQQLPLQQWSRQQPVLPAPNYLQPFNIQSPTQLGHQLGVSLRIYGMQQWPHPRQTLPFIQHGDQHQSPSFRRGGLQQNQQYSHQDPPSVVQHDYQMQSTT